MSAGAPPCPRCDAPAVPGARFCHACGRPLDPAAPGGARDAPPTERRVVTVLFGDLSDFTAWAEDLDPERVGLVADRALAAMSQAVTEVSGHVDKLTGDGIMAVFGAPVAHEDDPERAVRAAVGMQQAVGELIRAEGGGGERLGLRVGLNTGVVVAGVQAELAYTVVGDTVNTASRLSDVAGIGQIWAGRETALATMAVAAWRALPPLHLKGKREAVSAFELVGLRPTTGAPPGVGIGVGEAPLVGREAEVGALLAGLADVVQTATPKVIAVTGEAGIGKTRLVGEVARLAVELPALRLFWGRARSYGEGLALAPVSDWLATACGIGPADSPAQRRAAVLRTVERLAETAPAGWVPSETAEGLLIALGLDEGAAPGESAAPGGLGTAGAKQAVSTLFDAMAAQAPLLLVADDLQWAGPGLLADLAGLLSRLHGPVACLCVGRSDGPTGAWWERIGTPEVLQVAALGVSAAERLLRAYLGGAELHPASRQLLLDRAQGNPFFLAELLRLLVDRELLVRAGDGWALAGPVPADVLPAGVHAVLAARIDALAPPARAALRRAAVAGSPFRVPMLGALGSAAQLEEGLAQLEERGILVALEPQLRYRFSHELVRDVAYAALPKRDRLAAHAALACWVAEHPDELSGDSDAVIAQHARRAAALAGEVEPAGAEAPAVLAARRAGGRALERLAAAARRREEAVRAEALYGEALALAGPLLPEEEVARLHVSRAEVRVALHLVDQAEADLTAASRGARQALPAAALVVAGQIRRLRGDDPGAVAALVSALAAASEQGDDRTSAEALRQLGIVHYLAGRLGPAEEQFALALELAERIGDPRGTGWALQHLTWSATTRGAYRQAEASLRRAAEVFGELGAQAALGWCAGTEAFVRLLQGRLREARGLAGGLLPLAQAMGQRWGTAVCLTIDAFAAAELGELTVARSEVGRARELFEELADPWGTSMTLITAAFVRRGAGDPAGAVAELEHAVRIAETRHHPASASLALAGIGYCQLDLGRPDAAQAVAERALRQLEQLDVEPAARIGAEVLLAQALRGQGKLDEALRLLGLAAAAVDEPSLIFPRRQALAHLAGALLEAGEVSRAFEVACQALSVPAEDVRSRVIALRVLGSSLMAVGDAPAARVALRQALALATATEAVSERAATRAAAAKLG